MRFLELKEIMKTKSEVISIYEMLAFLPAVIKTGDLDFHLVVRKYQNEFEACYEEGDGKVCAFNMHKNVEEAVSGLIIQLKESGYI